MKDRLPDLRSIQSDETPPEYDPTFDGERNQGPYLDDFFFQITVMQKTLSKLKESIQDIKSKQSTILSHPHLEEKDKEELQTLVNEVQSMVSHLKVDLKDVNKNIKKHEKSDQGGFADIRIKKNQHAAMSRELLDIVSVFDTIQNDYKHNFKTKMKRQLEVANADTSVVGNAYSDNPETFKQGVEVEQMKTNIEEIESRNVDMKDMLKSIELLNELFTDIVLFVQNQSELIDSIEYNIEETSSHVEQAIVDTKKAVRYQSSARRKKIICVLICVVLLIIIAAVVTTQVT